MKTTAILASGLAALTAAAPTSFVARQTADVTIEQLTAVAPLSASCASAPFPDECADASRAAPAISAGFAKYGITAPAEKAALIALMVYESGSFQFNKNHYPGNPGQGTKNMQSAAFNVAYAADLGMSAADGVSALAAVSGDNETFGSAAWFVTKNCPAFRAGLQAGTPEGWTAYLTQCVGTTDTPDRDVVWQQAIAVFGH
jgi:hypothetical protein